MKLKIGLQGVNAGVFSRHFAMILAVAGVELGGAIPALAAAQSDGSSPQAASAEGLAAHSFPRAALTPSTRQAPDRDVPGEAGPNGWVAYLDGSSLRKDCAGAEADMYRFVYNADFDHQVRTYELSIPHNEQRPALLMARVISQGGRGHADDTGIFSYKSSIWAQRTLSRSQLEPILRSLAASQIGSPAKASVTLPSDTFYWVVSACVRGHFGLSAWSDVSQGANPPFAQELFSLDETAVPIRTPAAKRELPAFWSDFFRPGPSAKPEPSNVFKVVLTGGSVVAIER